MVKPVSAFEAEVPSEKDLKTVAAQLGREPRDVSAIAHRCPCGEPDVVQTPPRLADGTPFPTNQVKPSGFVSFSHNAAVDL